MGLFDKLNQLTSEMNNIADKITGGNTQQTISEQNNGLEGLGNLSIDKDNCALSSPYGFLNKVDNSVRLLETDMNKFSSTEDYSKYIKDFLSKTAGFIVTEVEEGLKQQLGTNDIFYAQHNSGFNFIVIPSLDYSEVQRILNLFQTNSIIINNTTKVIIGYFNYDNDAIRIAKNAGFELIGANEIFEINSDATSSIIPDLNFGSKHNSLKAIIGRALRNEKLATNQSNGNTNGIDSFASSIENTVNNISNSIEGALNKDANTTEQNSVSLAKSEK